MGGYIYIGGGYETMARMTDQVDRYSIVNDAWEHLPSAKLPFALNA